MTRKKADPMPQAQTSGATERKPQELARITKKLPRETELERTAKERHLAGHYRVITSNVVVPRPESEWRNPDGTHKPNEPTLDMAMPGDELYLGDEDAYRLLRDDIVEPLDAKPSRVGKVFAPPRVIPNTNALIGNRN